MRLLNSQIPGPMLALLVAEIALVTFIYLGTVFLFLDVSPEVWLFYDDGMTRLGVLVAGIILGLHFQDLYGKLRIRSLFELFQQVCVVIGMAFLLQSLFSYAAPDLQFPRTMMLVGSTFLLGLIPCWRWAYSGFVTRALVAERILFLGKNPVALQVAARIRERPEFGMSVLGFVDESAADEKAAAAEVLGVLGDFREIVARTRPDRIIIGMTERRRRLPVLDLLDIGFSGIRVEEAATAFEWAFGRVSTRELRPSQLIFTRELGPRPSTVKLQSIYSWLFAFLGVALTWPLMILVALLIKLTSRGPVLYRQERVGLNGLRFRLYKFRSMRTDAEAETGAVWATRNDPRVTFLGRWLRKLHLDELPQFFNVLKGEMLLVGPRPERPEFIQRLSENIPFYRQRLCIKPGITGWAQINHKYGDSIEDTIAKLEYDLYYIKNMSLTLDAYVVFQTIKVVLLSRGAQ